MSPDRPYLITFQGLVGRTLYDSATTIEYARAIADERHRRHPNEAVHVWNGGVLLYTVEART